MDDQKLPRETAREWFDNDNLNPIENHQLATPEPPRIQPRSITIEPAENGCVVYVGCKRFVFQDLETVTKLLHTYYSNPSKVEAEFFKTGKLPV